MTRTTVTLPTKLKARAVRLARDQGLSLDELIRDSLEQRLTRDAKPRRDPLFADHFVFTDDGPPDVAGNLDKYLNEIDDENYHREQHP